jgi:hypothetical protein
MFFGRDPPAVREDPHAAIEQSFIEDYLAQHSHTRGSLRGLPPTQARALMAQASTYASTKLAEVAARAQFVNEIHGVSPPL